ncbi:MAG: SRPBCC family protein [Sorangiineae bacterium]|nr:SRPBCC family protein [Polyangiaceae bacterium]MEB2321326.1 SRPBCC family protein [Sorangiineae bacterium]
MTDYDFKLGRLERRDQGFEGRLERVLAHPPAAVWRMLTEPSGLAKWLAPGTIELKEGGAVHIDFADSGRVIDSRVTECEPERLLVYSWSSGQEPERPMRWELAPAGEATRLTLTVTLPADDDAAKSCAGFDGHLEMLAAALEGIPVKFPFQIYKDARAGYQAMLDG